MADIDQKDEQILQQLTAHGRISNIDLADRVGLSPSACLRRVQELERSGLITGYRAVLNRTALGSGFAAYIGVGLRDHSKASQEAFERSISRAEQVRECHNVTGVNRISVAGRMCGPVSLQAVSHRYSGGHASGQFDYVLRGDGIPQRRTGIILVQAHFSALRHWQFVQRFHPSSLPKRQARRRLRCSRGRRPLTAFYMTGWRCRLCSQ